MAGERVEREVGAMVLERTLHVPGPFVRRRLRDGLNAGKIIRPMGVSFIQYFYIAALSRYFYPSFHSGILGQCEQLGILCLSFLLSPLT